MPILCGDRQQIALLPSSIEEYVSSQDRVRVYDAFIEHLSDSGQIEWPVSSDQGRPEYDPKTMVKLLLYSYSYGVRSSRQIERACHHNLSYIWLTGNLKPDHKTIARFRQENLNLLKGLLKQCVHLCVKLHLIDGHVLFIDGTKIRANASAKWSWTEKKCSEVLADLDERIQNLLAECQTLDQAEATQTSHVQMPEDLAQAQNLREKVQKALEELKTKEQKRTNLTDPDCAVMRSVQGNHAAYNVQNVVDDKQGLIVSTEAVSDPNDSQQFAQQVDNAKEQLGHNPQTVCADAGYANTEELEKAETDGVQVIVPSQTQALHEKAGPFHHDQFKYDHECNCYICPTGQILSYSGSQKPGISKAYRMKSGRICQACPHFGACTSSSRGRTITRMLNEETKKHFEALYHSPQGQDIYSKRKQKAEHPFGYIKRILKADGFLLRGRTAVQTESSLWATCFNLTRMITILGGVSPLIAQMST